jgi:P27 family predicted phage terminase small subunit
MARQERTKKSTVANSVKTMQSAKLICEPPFPLKETEATYFKSIVTAREHETWSDNDRLIAANLAKTYAAIDQLWGDINAEGYVVENQRGTPVANPKVSALNSMTSAMQSLNKTLGLSASQRGLSGAKQATRNSAEQQARKIIELAAEDDLI